MIPKVAWMHWSQNGPEPSWLRQQGVETFRKHNPDWDLRVIGTPDDIAEHGLDLAKEGDWTRWRMLSQFGGFAIGMDTVFVAPIPEKWRDCDFCSQELQGNVYQMAALGCVPGHGLAYTAEGLCSMAPEKHTGSDTSYQAFGTDMLRNITRGTLLTAFGNVFKMPDQAFCFYHFEADVPAMWSPDGPAKALPADAVGVQWFGGSPASKERDAGTSPDGPSWLERLARKELE